MSSNVPSPCTGVCRIDPASGWCEGCRRTIDEIVSWSSLGDPAKLRVWKLLRARRSPPEAGSPEPTQGGR
jgi:uncharacterized protein